MEKQPTKSGKLLDIKLLKRLFVYMKPYKKWFQLGLLLTIIGSLIAPVRPLLYQHIIDTYVVKGNLYGVRLFILACVGMVLFETVLSYVNTLLTNWLGQSVVRDMRNQVFKHILYLKLAFYDKTPIGQLQTRTVSDVETVNDVFRSGIVAIAGDLLQLIAILVAMIYINLQLTIVVLFTVPLMIITTRIFQKHVKESFQAVRKEVAAMNSFLQEHISGMNIVHIFNRENIEFARFDEINQRLKIANIQSVLYYSIFFPVIEFISALALALLVWYGVGRVLTDTNMQFGDIVAFISLVQMFFRPIRMLADQFNTLQMGMASAERLFHILDTQDIIPDEGRQANLPKKTEHFTIEFRNVGFYYTENEWVLRNINLIVNKGEKIAFVGATGSGKSTMIQLLGRFYDIQEGEILLNGINIRDYTLADLRRLMGVVLQDVFLFSGTIEENITLNNQAISSHDIQSAAQAVGAHEFITELPNGYHYQVSERGAALSLGQRQLIAFARVWIYNPLILILDEATANIDSESELVIQNAIETVMKGRTSIVIAHRLSTIQKADKIVVLEKGSILEIGTHKELIEKQGKYFELHQKQFELV